MHKWNGVTANECIADEVLELKLCSLSCLLLSPRVPLSHARHLADASLIALWIRSSKLFHNSLSSLRGCRTIAKFQETFPSSSKVLQIFRLVTQLVFVTFPTYGCRFSSHTSQPEIEGTSPNAKLIVFVRIKANRLLRLEIGLIKSQ